MKYLEADYQLYPVSSEVYQRSSVLFSLFVKNTRLIPALEELTRKEGKEFVDILLNIGSEIQGAYGDGGGFYGLALGIGITALREANPHKLVPGIVVEDWEQTIDREKELSKRPDIKTIEALSGIALLEISDVNFGYVDGYQISHDRPNLTPYLGFSGLATMHAHDLMHFASLRK